METVKDKDNFFYFDALLEKYHETDNPVYVWMAIDACESPQEIPDWAMAYLKKSASGIVKLSAPSPDKIGSAASAVYAALGMSEGSFNRHVFDRYLLGERNADLMSHIYSYLTEHGEGYPKEITPNKQQGIVRAIEYAAKKVSEAYKVEMGYEAARKIFYEKRASFGVEKPSN